MSLLVQGLGEEYADDYVRAKTGNSVEDKDEKTRDECRVLLKSLFAKLDSLSHFHFAPKPIIKEMAVQKEVPALAMEEIGPQVSQILTASRWLQDGHMNLFQSLMPEFLSLVNPHQISMYISKNIELARFKESI